MERELEQLLQDILGAVLHVRRDGLDTAGAVLLEGAERDLRTAIRQVANDEEERR